MSATIIINAVIITVNEQNDCFHHGAVAFEGGVITYVGDMPADFTPYDRVIDAAGHYVMPGLVNTHGHTPMSLLRGYADDLPLKQWLEDKMWPREAQFSAEHAKWGAYLSIVEMLRTGTTTFVDMYDHMDTVAEAVATSGMRARLCRGMIGLGSQQERDQKLTEAAAFARDWDNKAEGRITTMLSPHAPYSCPPDFIRQIVDQSHELDVPIHIHMSETQAEVEENVEAYGERPVFHLQNLGVFERPTLVAHAVHVTDEEIDVLAKKDVKVSHNIISNLKLGSGVAPVPAMLDTGIAVSLGTDSSASNNNLDLFDELRQVALLFKGLHKDPTLITDKQALRMATIAGADAIWQKDRIGSLEVGKDADLVVVDATEPFYHPPTDPVSHLVYAASGRDVRDVFIKGRQVVRARECTTVDQEKVMFEADRMYQKLQ